MGAKLFNLIIFTILLQGCYSKAIDEIIYTNISAAERDKPSDEEPQNELFRDTGQYEKEKSYVGTANWPPEYGLALSGGGTRSASFSIGVLKALQEADKLNQIKIISSVSGGAYATYWFYSQEFYKDRLCNSNSRESSFANYCFSTKTIFKRWSDVPSNLDEVNDYRFQRYLENSSNILNYAHKPSLLNGPKNNMQFVVEWLIQGLTIPLHWVLNGVFDTELNITPFFYYYKDGLDRTYGYVPLDYTLDHFVNSERAFFGLVPNIDARPLHMAEIREFLKTRKSSGIDVPYFIINATAGYGRWKNRYGTDQERTVENSVFEITPWGCHSSLLKNTQCPRGFNVFIKNFGRTEIDLSRAVSISGAAVDSQFQVVDVNGNLEDPYKLSVGLDILNLNLGVYVSNPDADPVHLFIHKLLPWPLYVIDDLLLWDASDSPTLYLSDGGHSENLGVLSLIKRKVQNILIIDAEQDGKSNFTSAKLLAKTLKKHQLTLTFNQRNNDLISVYNAQPDESFIKGEILDANGTPISKILYLKLATNPRHAQSHEPGGVDLPFTVRSYQELNPEFPHDSTADVYYDKNQFRAYRDLGYTLMEQTLKKTPDFFNR